MSHDREKKCLDDRIIVDTSSRPAGPWSSTAWREKANGGASTGQRVCWRCARSRRVTAMISVIIGGSMPTRCGLATTLGSRNTSPLCD
jgi:hypothetical protein